MPEPFRARGIIADVKFRSTLATGEAVRRGGSPGGNGMLPSASLAGALAGILAIAAIAAHVLIDGAFRLLGG